MDERRLEALIAEKGRVYDAVIDSTSVLYPGAAACIARMAAAFPLGIASGALRHEIEAVLRREGLERHFRFIVASGDTLQSKPAPDPYRRAAELHGLPPRRAWPSRTRAGASSPRNQPGCRASASPIPTRAKG